MTMQIKKSERGKWLLIDEFEIGNSGEYDVRVVASNLSFKKAKELKEKYDK
jgi:hypothetical protein